MKNTNLEKWTWILIYAGLFVASLGVFMHEQSPGFGWALMAGGGGAAAVGALLIFVRARRGD